VISVTHNCEITILKIGSFSLSAGFARNLTIGTSEIVFDPSVNASFGTKIMQSLSAGLTHCNAAEKCVKKGQ